VNLPVSAPGGLVGSTAGSTIGSTTGSTIGSTTGSTTNDTRTDEEKAHDEDRKQGGGTSPDGDTGNPYIDEDPVIRQARAEIGRYSEDQLRNFNFGDLDPYDTESMIMDEVREFGLLNSEAEILRDQMYNNPVGLISTLEPGIPQQNATTGEIAVAAAKQAEADRIASIPDVINRAVAIRAAEKAPSGDMERRAADAAAKAAQAARNRAKAAAAQAARDRAAQAAAHQRNVAKAAALAAAQAERDRQSRAQAAAAAAADRKRAEAIFAADRRNQSSVEAVLASLRGAGSGIGAGAGNRGGIGRLGSGPLGHSADVGRASMGRAF
jgi:chemotaxis protein histidine kinase CheA